MDENQLKAKIVEWLTLRGEVAALEKAIPAIRHQKGVHLPPGPSPLNDKSGNSRMGYENREAVRTGAQHDKMSFVQKLKDVPGTMGGYSTPAGMRGLHNKSAKIEHKRIFDQLRAMPKPNLPKSEKSLSVEPAGVSDPMQHNRIDNNSPKIANSPNKINPFRNIMKSLQKRSQR